jgi:signal transduction histidine kinase/GAF domain-containing protein
VKLTGPRSVARRIRRLKIGPRLALGFVFIILLMLSMNAVLLSQLNVIRAQTAHLNAIDRKVAAVFGVHTALVESYDRLEKVVQAEDAERMAPEVDSLRSFVAAQGALAREALSRLPPGAQLDTTVTLTVDAIEVSLGSQLEALTELARARDWEGVRLRLINDLRPLQSETSRLVAEVSRGVEDERALALESIRAADRRIVLTVSIAGVLAVLLAGILGVALTRSITKPLRQLVQGSQALARGEFGHRVSVPGGDELAELGQVVNDAAGKLRELYDTLAAEKRLLEVIAKGGSPLPSFFDGLCACLEDAVPGSRSAVWLVERNGTRLVRAAAPKVPEAYSDAVRARLLEPEWSAPAMAVHRKRQVVVADMATDTRFDPGGWPALALSHGLRACWSTPVLADGEVRGIINLYHSEPRSPSEYHTRLLEQMSHVARIAIERAETEDALRRSEASLAAAQRLTQTGSWRWRPAMGEIEWSEQTYRIYDIDPAVRPTLELVLERVHPEDRPALRGSLERTLEGRAFDFDHRLLMPDGSVRHLHVTTQPFEDEAGRVVEFVGAVTDVTGQKRSAEALDKIRTELAHVARVATLGELTASIAHEVNQPLSGIMTNASTCLRLLAADPPKLAQAAETARRTLRDAKRAADVISRLRALFKKSAAPRERVDINEAISEVIALTRHEVQARSVALRTELSADVPPVIGDRVQLQQVVLNLVLNSAEAMSSVEGRPRELVVATSREGTDELRVAVRDSGIGLDPDAGPRLFEAFYTTKRDGMGMGLSIARSIVESHGGRLWAAPNEGPGATFVFTLPLGLAAVQTHTKG